MTARKRIKKPETGAIVEIPLPNGQKGYARILKSPLMAFYAIQSDHTLSTAEILGQPIAFKIWVKNSAITSGRWHLIGHASLDPELDVSPWFFKQDVISKVFTLYQNGVERPASRNECLELERATVWSAEHAESRLADYLEGRSNKWVNALGIKE